MGMMRTRSVGDGDARMEGWLYIIRSNRFGLQFSRKRYFILEDNCLRFYKSVPDSSKEEPVRSAVIDSCIRVNEDGRESINRKVFFMFTLYSRLNYNDQLKLGASSSEDAAKWTRSLQIASLKECSSPPKDFSSLSKKSWAPFRLSMSKKDRRKGRSHSYSPVYTEAMTSDVVAPSPWKIFGCQNGLRLFKESDDSSSQNGWLLDDNPAIMAVGVVDGPSEAIFRLLMSLGSTRSEWDFCFYRGTVVEHIDGHTDIIHKQLYRDWLPWGMGRRDLLLRRYWRREEDGTYVILYQSVIHKKCLPKKGYVRAVLKSGGYVVSPVNQGRQSVVKHMLSIDWKCWKAYMQLPSSRSITVRMLERVAALRELFKTKTEDQDPPESDFLSMPRKKYTPILEVEEIKHEVEESGLTEKTKVKEDNAVNEERVFSPVRNLISFADDTDEFFDFPDVKETMEYDLEQDWSVAEMSQEPEDTNLTPPRLSSTANIVKKLHDLAVNKKAYTRLDSGTEDDTACPFGATLQKDQNGTLPCSWAAAEPSTFLIRGENYLKDNQKIKAKGTLMQMVGADWLKSNQREDNLGGRSDSIVQKGASQGRSEFFFIVNLQVPTSGAFLHTLALYYVLKTPLEETPLLHKFVNGDDTFRNSRFKLIPNIAKGSWIVKQSVGKKACLIGHALETQYFRGENYLEILIDVGSSTVARGVTGLVYGYMTNLVVELAFLIQADTEEELPECLIGACRLSHLDASKAVLVRS